MSTGKERAGLQAKAGTGSELALVQRPPPGRGLSVNLNPDMWGLNRPRPDELTRPIRSYCRVASYALSAASPDRGGSTTPLLTRQIWTYRLYCGGGTHLGPGRLGTEFRPGLKR